ncbi:hypothetical protein [Mesorhizobium sp.]|uniref:hypothetical protein n=1 Tax=Mesorhizobium sp. TaxID=1871066 RepID=UPI0025CF45E7|nr:hypothetical protein [Mesorhizobium sp.]
MVLMTIRNGRKQTCQPTFSAAPSAYLVPFLPRQHCLGRDRRLVRDVILAAPAGGRDPEDQINIGPIDLTIGRIDQNRSSLIVRNDRKAASLLGV